MREIAASTSATTAPNHSDQNTTFIEDPRSRVTILAEWRGSVSTLIFDDSLLDDLPCTVLLLNANHQIQCMYDPKCQTRRTSQFKDPLKWEQRVKRGALNMRFSFQSIFVVEPTLFW